MKKIVWLSHAEQDVVDIFSQELDRTGSCLRSDSLLEEINSRLNHLIDFPLLGKWIIGDIRRILVGNREYGLYYEPQKDRLLIHAVLNLRQDPESIRQRLGG